MERIKKFFKKDKFAEYCGIELLDASVGRSKVRMEVKPIHLNAMGSCHGGALMTLADFAFAVACNSHGTIAVAISTNTLFMKAVSSGWLTAEAEETSVNPRLGSYTVRITDEADDLVAIFQGLSYRKKDPLDLSE